jgi:PP-loop superfamily ATP-utilizing enzyme
MFDFLSESKAGLCGTSHLKRREFLQVGALSALGYQYITLDLAGFRSGNLNWALEAEKS